MFSAFLCMEGYQFLQVMSNNCSCLTAVNGEMWKCVVQHIFFKVYYIDFIKFLKLTGNTPYTVNLHLKP